MEEDVLLDNSGDLPHFGDEESLRCARPVVPLGEVRSSKLPNLLLLGAALLGALGLGAGVALLMVRVNRPRPVQTQMKPKSVDAAKSEDPTVAAVGDEEEMMDLPTTEEDSNSEAQTSNNEARTSNKKSQTASQKAQTSIKPTPPSQVSQTQNRASQNQNVASTSRGTLSTSQSDNEAPQKPILVDQWEEKRSRRVSQERTSEVVRHRDLFRIRDIFEGVSRKN